MKSFKEYKLELLKLISSLNILELQKNELRNYVKNKLHSSNYEKVVKNNKPEDYLKHIIKSYGKNNYTIYIILNSIMNLFIFNGVYFGIMIYKDYGFNQLPINIFVELSIILITLIIFPLLKLTIRKGLLENWNGKKIIMRSSIILASFFVINIFIYQIDLFNRMIFNIDLKIIGPTILIFILIIQILLRFFKYDESFK